MVPAIDRAAPMSGGGERGGERPETIGPYRVVSTLGRGGMGVVYLAEHRESGEAVALKQVSVADAGTLSSIRREIHALSRLCHPGVVRIVGAGLENGLPWYAMELLRGMTLDQYAGRTTQRPSVVESEESETTAPPAPEVAAGPRWWTQTLASTTLSSTAEARETRRMERPARTPISVQLSPPEAQPVTRSLTPVVLRRILTLVRRLCAPLAYMHGEGLVHRDLKPANVLLGLDGMPVLVDFGLTSCFGGAQGRETLECSGLIMGTLGYISPEQASGELVDARADLYSLGCMLYELLAGRLPFESENGAALIWQHIHVHPPAPSGHAAGIPAELDELVLRLLAKEPRDRLGYAEDVAVALSRMGAEDGAWDAAPRPRTYLYRPGFSGRRAALRELVAELDLAAEGGGKLVLVGGEAGIGKTRLVSEASRLAVIRGFHVLLGECLPQAGIPFQGLRKPLQSMADLCRELPRGEATELLVKRGKVLAAYEPAFGHLPGQEYWLDPADLPSGAAKLRLWMHVKDILEALARERAVLVILDDLQWADDLTAGFLEYLARGARTWLPRLLLIGTYRTDEKAPDFTSLRDAPGAKWHVLDRLDPGDVGQMAADMLALGSVPESLGRYLASQSEGNPFFVAEYLRLAVSEGLLWRDSAGRWQIGDGNGRTSSDYGRLPLPASVRELMERRIAGLGPKAIRVAEAAAAIGPPVPGALLGLVPELGGGWVEEGLAELLRRQVVEECEPGTYRFPHEKLRQAVYQRVDQGRLSHLHATVAIAMEQHFAATPEEREAELADHWRVAGEAVKARGLYLSAARRAANSHAHVEAERLYRAFLGLCDGPTAQSIAAHNELGGRVYAVQGRPQDAMTEQRKALDEARAIGDRALEAASLREVAILHDGTGESAKALEILDHAVSIARTIGDVELEQRALGSFALIHWHLGHMDEARDLLVRSLEAMRRTGDRRNEGVQIANLANHHYEQGRLREARDLCQQALAIHREVGDRLSEARALSNLALYHIDLDLLDEAEALLQAALAVASEVGARSGEGIQMGNLGMLLHKRGRLEEARSLLLKALAIAREVGDQRLEGIWLGDLGILNEEGGKMEEARGLYEEALSVHRKAGYVGLEGVVLCYLARLERRAGDDLAGAEELARKGADLIQSVGDNIELLKASCVLGHIALARDRSARPELQRAQELARELSTGEGAQAVARLDRAVMRSETGGSLVLGECPEDITEGAMRWLREHRPAILDLP